MSFGSNPQLEGTGDTPRELPFVTPVGCGPVNEVVRQSEIFAITRDRVSRTTPSDSVSSPSEPPPFADPLWFGSASHRIRSIYDTGGPNVGITETVLQFRCTSAGRESYALEPPYARNQDTVRTVPSGRACQSVVSGIVAFGRFYSIVVVNRRHRERRVRIAGRRWKDFQTLQYLDPPVRSVRGAPFS